MFRILAALAGITLVTSLTSAVYAKPIIQFQLNPGVLALLGGHRHEFESRSIPKDYQTRFSKPLLNSLNTHNSSFGIPTSKAAGESGFPSGILGEDLGNRLESNTGKVFESHDNTNQSLFSDNSDNTDTKGTLLYKLINNK